MNRPLVLTLFAAFSLSATACFSDPDPGTTAEDTGSEADGGEEDGAVCGNGVVEAGEACDDGNGVNTDS